jgi:hypothetical protein
LQNIKIKKSTECTGFSDVKTSNELIAKLEFNKR